MKGDTGTNARQNAADSKVEIDTRAPFSSVKAAVSIFGEVRSRKPRPGVTPGQPENPTAKDSQLLLAKKELNKYKEQLDHAETTRTQALAELERAKGTVEELTNKLIAINESKNMALEAAEIAKDQTKKLDVKTINNTDEDRSWEWEFENARDLYAVATMELGAAKQELRKIKKDFDALVENKLSAIQREAESKQLFDANNQKAMEVSKEIGVAQGSLMHMRTATEQVQQEESMILSDKAATEKTYKQMLQETVQKLTSLKKEFDPDIRKNLEAKLAKTNFEIVAAQNIMENMPTTDLDFVAIAAAELHGAKEMLQKLAKEESSLISLLESLKVELEAARTEHAKLKKMDAETESVVSNLHLKLQKCKADLEAATAGGLKASSPSDDLMPTLQQLSSDSKKALQEAEEMKRNAEKLRGEAEAARLALEEAEKKLQVALKDAEEAKSAEVRALELLKDLPDKENVAQASTSLSGSNITISKEEYESLICKVAESEKLSEMRAAAAIARMEVVETSENEANKKLEVVQKEMEDIERATEEALRRANLAEAAKKAVEGELKRLREKEPEMADESPIREFDETPIREFAETQMSGEGFPPKPAGHSAKPPEKNEEHRKFGRPISRKAFIPNFGGFFHRKKSISGGTSPSLNPADKPV